MVIAYLRVSTFRQHVENQKVEIERYASARGITIDRWVTEVVSGKESANRRKLSVLIKKLKKGDILFITELSRLSRTLTEIMSILNVLLKKEVILHSTKDGYLFDNTINSKILAFAFGLVAEIEHNLISARTREALAARKAAGMVLGRPHGSSPKTSVLITNKEKIEVMLSEGRTVEEIYRKYKVSRSLLYQFIKDNDM